MAQPLWVMCGVCGDVLYGGPGINPIPRECGCAATIVIPLEERGVVKWDAAKYKQAAAEAGQKAWVNFRLKKAEELGTKYASLGFKDDELAGMVQQALEELEPQREGIIKQAEAAAMTEPEIEYTEHQLDPNATRRMVPERTLDDIVGGHYVDLEKGFL